MSKKILVVDDDKDLSYIVKSFLDKHGYEATAASDGGKALEAIKTETFDLIIADLTMPVLGGWHFISKVREDPRYKEVPIIVVSGLLQQDSEPEQFEAATAQMAKPFEVFKLLDKIRALLKENS